MSVRDFAKRLMLNEHGVEGGGVPTAIFGSAGGLGQSINLARTSYRIALYPLISDDQSEVFLGIGLVIGLLLERWSDVTVYRLPMRLDDSTEPWSIEKSNFASSDWELSGLDDNIAITGNVSGNGNGQLILLVQVESEGVLEDEDSSLDFSSEHNTIGDLVNHLPVLAQQIASKLGFEQLDHASYVYETASNVNESQFLTLLTRIFQWERDIFLSLWEEKLPENHLKHLDEIIKIADELADDASMWLGYSSLEHVLTPYFIDLDKTLIDYAEGVVSTTATSPIPSLLIAPVLFELGRSVKSYEILVSAYDVFEDNAFVCLRLADLYRRGGRIIEAIETLQRGAQQEIKYAPLYQHYADLLNIADYMYDVDALDHLVFLNVDDEDEGEDNIFTQEAIEALYEGLEIDPDNIDMAQSLLGLLSESDSDPEDIWEIFEKIIELDVHGAYTRIAIDLLYRLDDLQPAIALLQDTNSETPTCRGYTNLALVYNLAEDITQAEAALEKAKELVETNDDHSTIEEIVLRLEFEDFETRFGELQAILDSDTRVSPKEVEFLETVVEEAPHFAAGAYVLAKGYLLWEEMEAALETVLDALKHSPDDPELADLAAQIIWTSSDNSQLAFQYINKGLEKYPTHVPLLVRAAEYLFELDELDQSRYFMSRAERINPRHPRFRAVQQKISRNIDITDDSVI